MTCPIYGQVIRPRQWGWVIARGVFGGTAVLLYFTCIEKIGVGIAKDRQMPRNKRVPKLGSRSEARILLAEVLTSYSTRLYSKVLVSLS